MSLPNEHTSDLSQHARVQDWGGGTTFLAFRRLPLVGLYGSCRG